MGKTTAIEWTDATFNPWWGCERVSPACAHCYAADVAKRWGNDLWAKGEFRFLSDGYWRKPVRWNHEAEHGSDDWPARTPMFVFCASMADVFQDHDALVEPRERLWELVDATPWLVWLLLTKRPENIGRLSGWTQAPPNVWLGTSVENARHTFRVDHLVEVPAPVHFLSCEPLLGSLFEARGNRRPLELGDVEWVIGGGESGPNFRAPDPAWARELRDASRDASVPFFWKQWGGRHAKQGGKQIDGRQWCQRPTPAAPAAMAQTLF